MSVALKHKDPVAEAAAWLASTTRAERGPAVPELRRRFGLSLAEAVAIVRARHLELSRAN